MYYSRDSRDGPLGPGWHHPLDAAVREEGRLVKVTLPDGRESPHDALEVGASVWDAIDRYTLERTKGGYRLTFWDGRSLHFEPVQGAAASHPLLRITDRCDNAIELRYRDGRLAEVTDSVGRVLRFATSGGRLIGVKLRRRDGEWMDLVRYEYDAEGRLSAALDPMGAPLRYAYKGGVLVKETNRNGLSFHFAYDWYHPAGYCVRTWGDGGIYERRLTYDEHRHVTVVDDSRGGRTLYYGNPGGLVDREVDPTGREMRYEWHPTQYRKTAEVDGMRNRTEWAYDEHGNTVLERDALGHETRWKYDAQNIAVECVDAEGNIWKWDHDRRGCVVRAENPLGEVTRIRHDGRGNLVCVEDPQGYRTELRYTDAGEPAQAIDEEGRVTHVAVDDRGQIVRQVDPLGGDTVITRDVCGRPVAVRRPDGSSLHASYDAEGNVTEVTDALGNVTRYRYAGFNQLVEQVDPLGGTVRYAYDTEEDLVGVTNELGEAYRIELDLAGRVVKERGFDGRTIELLYDRAGRCVEMVNAQKKRTKVERDALGRVNKLVIPRNPVMGDPIPKGEVYEYTFNALGRLVRAKNDACEVTLKRDALGRVTEERIGEHVIESRYDVSGNRVGWRTSLGHETLYDFDGRGDLAGVKLGVDPRWMDFTPESLARGGSVRAPWRATLRRNRLGNETERHLPGGVVARWDRDAVGRPEVHRVLREDAQISAVGYRWHSYEQLAGLIDTKEGVTWFEHDARSYLVAATRPNGSVEHRAPDEVGNVYRSRERNDRVYENGGVLREADGIRFRHDADGQLVEKVLRDGRAWKYTWDHAGQLAAVTRPDGQEVTFSYDALGRRVNMTARGHTTRYLWDGDDLVHEIADGAEAVTWVFEPGTFTPLAKIEGEQRFAVVTDHLGTPRMLMDDAGEVAWLAELDLYGSARIAVEPTRCPWRFPGQYADETTGLHYNRFRYYDPVSGRYASQDPIGLLGGLNAYAYVPDPLTWIDPLGLVFGLYEFFEGG